MTGTLCNAAHLDGMTRCVQPSGGMPHDVHEDRHGRRWIDDEVIVDALDDVDEQPDVPAEVWVLRGALGIAAGGAVLLVVAFGLAVASVWTSGLLSDRLFETALLCLTAGFVAVVAGRAGIRSARGDDVEPLVDVDAS